MTAGQSGHPVDPDEWAAQMARFRAGLDQIGPAFRDGLIAGYAKGLAGMLRARALPDTPAGWILNADGTIRPLDTSEDT